MCICAHNKDRSFPRMVSLRLGQCKEALSICDSGLSVCDVYYSVAMNSQHSLLGTQPVPRRTLTTSQ